MYIKKILFLILILVTIGLGIFTYFIYNTLLTPNTKFEEEYHYVYIKNDDTYLQVYEQLDSLLKDPEKFDIVAQQKKYAYNIKPGRYRLINGMTNNDIINVLRSQNHPFPLLFNNQDRLPKLAHRIAQQIEADSAGLMNAMTDTVFLAENGFSTATALNMYIPNKYEFYWNTSPQKFREKMLKEYHRFWNNERLEKAKTIGLTPNEVQNLAAIVQKETAKADERKRVAGVYMNRINKDWKLEADPTVIYALKNRGMSYDTTTIKRVLYKDLEVDSPYNTYLHKGIPPGPIAMPDISSIDAVLNYERHDFFYFVANPQKPGYHNFSKSLVQHNRYKNEYVKWIRKLNINR